MTKIETIPILLLIDDYIYHLLNLCQYTRRKWLLNALAWGVEGVSPLFFFAKVVLCLTHGLLTRNGCKKFVEDSQLSIATGQRLGNWLQKRQFVPGCRKSADKWHCFLTPPLSVWNLLKELWKLPQWLIRKIKGRNNLNIFMRNALIPYMTFHSLAFWPAVVYLKNNHKWPFQTGLSSCW